MASLSKTLLIGYLGQDPEKKVTSGGHSVVSVNLSTTERWKDKQGNRQEKTEWHKLQVWGEQADRFESWLKKGSCVYIEGQNETQEWTDKDNNKRFTTYVKVRNFQPLDKREQGQQQSTQQQYQAPPQQNQNYQQPQPQNWGPPSDPF